MDPCLELCVSGGMQGVSTQTVTKSQKLRVNLKNKKIGIMFIKKKIWNNIQQKKSVHLFSEPLFGS